ncbi:hypothetical protein ACE7GA_06560 [Roseomonas sp. CCTCC AB2023176]|uniref:hypothetical protein n=1 Tax=Roseomonas sp. CCTCC AB2023176 TaxID=3342640 RepID=UPI0035E31C8F
MTNKHPQHTGQEDGLGEGIPRPPSDLDRNPGIGSSKGIFGRGTDPKVLNGDSTDEGDVMNDADQSGHRAGGVDPDHRGRTNK